MTDSNRYIENFKDPFHLKFFHDFKNIVLEEEIETAKQVGREIVKLFPNIPLKIFEIGFGDGRISREFALTLMKNNKIEFYDGIEVPPSFVSEMKNQFDSLELETDFVVGDANNFDISKAYNLIVSFNSWYGISLSKINPYTEFLQEGGVLIIVLNVKDSLSNDIVTNFTDENIVHAEALQDYLKQNNFNFEAIDLDGKGFSKDQFIDGNRFKSVEAENFFRYLHRDAEENIEKLIKYLREKDDSYFKIPLKCFIISGKK